MSEHVRRPGSFDLVALAAALLLAGCARTERLTSCRESLDGIWRADGVSSHGETVRIHLVDRGDSVEGLPLHRDVETFAALTAETVLAAPSLLVLRRGTGDGADTLTGTLARRYQRGAATCTLRTPALLHGCRRDRAILDVTPPAPPSDWTLCAPGPSTSASWAIVRE